MNLAIPVPTFNDLWLLAGAIFASFAWCVRLEAKVMYMAESKEKLSNMEKKLSEISESLARLEGKLENHHQ